MAECETSYSTIKKESLLMYIIIKKLGFIIIHT